MSDDIKKGLLVIFVDETTISKVMHEMMALNANSKFTISSFNNNGIEKLIDYLFSKCETAEDK